MPVTLVTASLQPASGVPEDVVQNNWVIFHPTLSPTPASTLQFTGPINNFYSDLYEWYSNGMKRGLGAISYKLYDITAHLGGSNHGSPVATDSGAQLTAAANSNDVPTEVSVVLTLRALGWEGAPVESPDDGDADAAPERPKSRLTGRLYLGPFNTAVLAAGGRPADFFLDEARQAYVDAAADLAAFGGHFSVWSRESGTTRRVTDVQTDNAFDTQRRRGVAPSMRKTSVVPAP